MKSFQANLDSLYSMLDYARTCIALHAVSEEDISKIELALEEALVNVIYYAYPDEKGEILLECVFTSDKPATLKIQIQDYGIPFNPLEYSKNHTDKETLGGHGINYIKQIMDNVIYKRENNSNLLILEKKLIFK
ncbi:MAG: ATP-binding protein [Parachlamydiales bacterium]|jgi:anti-sigma regulatory factor (Ser/Thr protein kinase)